MAGNIAEIIHKGNKSLKARKQISLSKYKGRHPSVRGQKMLKLSSGHSNPTWGSFLVNVNGTAA